MSHRINERNIGESKLDSSPKKRKRNTLTDNERNVLIKVLVEVRESMRQDADGEYYDGGRFTLKLTDEEMTDLFNVRIKI